MDLKRITILSFITVITGLFLPMTAFGMTTTPPFPSCDNPQGSIQAHYDNGIHGIAGDTNTHTGADTVYKVSDTTYLQCFCPASGQGIQTNWWNAAGMDEDTLESYEQQGWISIPFGADWGLTNDQYLAKNSSYTCSSQTATSQSSSQSTAVIESGTQSNLSSPSNGSAQTNNTGGSTNNTGGSGLANTGDSILMYGTFFAGILSLLIGLLLKNKN